VSAAEELADIPHKTNIIVGPANARHFIARTEGKYYIQVATFKTVKNAEKYKHQ